MSAGPDPFGPFSPPPLAGSKSDRPWVRLNASLFHPTDAWSLLKAVAVVFGVILFAFPMAYVLFGGWGVAVLIWVLAAVLVVRIARGRGRRARSTQS